MKIKLGYGITGGEQVDIPIAHLVVCGVTALSGKTTTLEALISRSGKKAIVFKTKIGEKNFDAVREITPFFKDRSDYEFVRSLIEAYSKEKLFIEKGTLMSLCKDSKSLADIKESIDNTLLNSKLRAMEKEIYVRLQHYLENLLPQLRNAHLSKTLVLGSGVNLMDLEKFSSEVQSLVIQSVLDEVLTNHKDTIIVIPEAWKFVPQKYNNPCKRAAESFIRQGATNGNYLWIDSQEMASVDKGILKQVSVWLLGLQTERNEVKHTLDQIPLPSKSKPKEDEVMTLKIGQFFLASSDGMKRVYIQPAWLNDEEAKMVAMGQVPTPVQKVVTRQTRIVPPIIPQVNPPSIDFRGGLVHGKSYEQSLVMEGLGKKAPDDIRMDYLETQLKSLRAEVFNRVEELEMKIRSQTPSVYMVSPLEKIQKDFQAEAVNFVLAEAAKLDEDQKKILLFVESQKKGCSLTMIIDKCLHLSTTSGGTRGKYAKKIKEMDSLKVIRKDKNSVVYPNLKEFVSAYCSVHGATEQEMQQVYEHVLGGMVK